MTNYYYQPQQMPPNQATGQKTSGALLGILGGISAFLCVFVLIMNFVAERPATVATPAPSTDLSTPADLTDETLLTEELGIPEIPSDPSVDFDFDYEVVDMPQNLKDALAPGISTEGYCFLADDPEFLFGVSGDVPVCDASAAGFGEMLLMVGYFDDPAQIADLRKPPGMPYTEVSLTVKAKEGHDIKVTTTGEVWHIIDIQSDSLALNYPVFAEKQSEVEDFLKKVGLAE